MPLIQSNRYLCLGVIVLIHAPKGRARIVNALINSHHAVNMACAPACWSGPHGSSRKCSSRRSSRGRCGRPTEKSAEVDPADSAHQGAGISTSRFHHLDLVLFALMLTFVCYHTYTAYIARSRLSRLIKLQAPTVVWHPCNHAPAEKL